MSTDLILFSLLSLGSIVTALLMMTRRNPMISVLFLIVNFFFLAVLYLTLQAQFIAIIQILVYAGAIMVLFLFVIMLLNLKEDQMLAEKFTNRKLIAVILSFAMLVQFTMPFVLTQEASKTMSSRAVDIGTVESVGSVLFTRYVFPFEIVSLLLLVAIVGAVVLAKKKLR